MICRTISRTAFVAAAVSFGSVCFASEMAKNVLQKAGNNVGTIMGIAVATGAPEDCDAAKAAIETTGVLLDQVFTGKTEPAVLALNFVANVGSRKGMKCLNANGVKVPSPEVGGLVGSHVVSPVSTILKAAAPQIVAGLVVMGAKHAGVL